MGPTFNRVYRNVLLVLLTVVISSTVVSGQSQLLPLSKELQLKLGSRIYFDSLKVRHTALPAYFISEVSGEGMSRDSLLTGLYPPAKEWQSKNWVYRKLFTEHLVEVNDSAYNFYLDFIPDFQIGKQGANKLWLNTRGVELGGNVGKSFSFTSYFYENQGRFADYYTEFSFSNRVVPGQGLARAYGNAGIDYNYSGGTISYTPSKYLNLQVGYDKNFIGDGYRSLLLSDNSFNYPFAKVTASLGRVRYMVMFAQFIDLYENADHEQLGLDSAYPKKYGIFHYLNWNVSNRFSIGLFENVMWEPRQFEMSYLPPVVFLRPVEFANGSPDKVLMGLNASYKIAKNYVGYGQFMLNEFRIDDILSSKGSWANKNGIQLGIKGFDIFKVKNLNGQLEMNRVRPYSYSALSHFKNYGHYNQSLAHPYGANFREYLGIFNYRYKRFDATIQATRATYGLDIDGLNYGKDIYKNYDTRVAEDGVFNGQGLNTKLHYAEFKLAYVLNPKNNLRLETGYIYRNERNDQRKNLQQVFTIGLRASFRTLYHDF